MAEALQAGGFKAEALNGDMAQNAREQTVNRLKKGHIDILAATDVAARGLDVDRISHVVNFDMPSRVAPYIHRIGRTGRAGRSGEAVLLLNRNEKWMLKAIEKQTGTKITEMVMPSDAVINQKELPRFTAGFPGSWQQKIQIRMFLKAWSMRMPNRKMCLCQKWLPPWPGWPMAIPRFF